MISDVLSDNSGPMGPLESIARELSHYLNDPLYNDGYPNSLRARVTKLRDDLRAAHAEMMSIGVQMDTGVITAVTPLSEGRYGIKITGCDQSHPLQQIGEKQ